MRQVAYCTTREVAHEMRDTYCEDVLGIDSESEGGAYIFIVKYSTNRLFDF